MPYWLAFGVLFTMFVAGAVGMNQVAEALNEILLLELAQADAQLYVVDMLSLIHI